MKKIENIGIDQLAAQLTALNKGKGHISYLFMVEQHGEKAIVTDLDMSKAIFPEGYYFNSKNGITNKHRTTSGQYETIRVFTLVEM